VVGLDSAMGSPVGPCRPVQGWMNFSSSTPR